MSIEYGRLDASFCTLFWSRTRALSYTCTALLPPHALTSTRKNTATIARKPFLSHRAEFILIKVTPPSTLNTVAKKYNYRIHAKRQNNSRSFSCKQASHFWPGDGNSSIAPFAVYGKGLSLKTSDRCISMHF